MEMEDLTILCNTKANLNGRMKIKARQIGNVVFYRGGNNSYRGRDNSNPRGGLHGKCYRCSSEGHRYFECKSYGENISRNVVIQGEFEHP